jgi:prevent-host-death family protein
MIKIGSFEAKNRVSELLSRAERGEKIVITRRGKKIAILVSYEAYESKEKLNVETLLDRFSSFRNSASAGPESLKQLIEEGR